MRLSFCRTLPIFILFACVLPSLTQDKNEDKSQERSDRLSAMDVFNLQYAGDPQISQDGKRIVYVRQFSDVMNDKRESNLWMIRRFEQFRRRLIHRREEWHFHCVVRHALRRRGYRRGIRFGLQDTRPHRDEPANVHARRGLGAVEEFWFESSVVDR
jgi:hypothetical protein